ncbi:MAG TPA: cytochrome c oxidase assembly protein [Gemmataceae bacterium]|jgi:cytochrome c oxidase assembly factor CtaG
MSPLVDAFLRSWPFDPWLIVMLVLPAAIYLRGWLRLHRRDPEHWHGGQLLAFLGGLTILFLALASPIEPFAALLLQVHMVQHLLLMMLVPPLLWLGAPLFPFLRGLPQPIRVYWIAPVLKSRSVRVVCGRVTHPLMSLPLFTGVAWIWHIPKFYEIALQSNYWHYLQHICFLSAGLIFWYPVVRPYPSRPRWLPWLLLPYLLLADVQNTALSALLTFASRVLYPYYEQVPRVGGVSALEDQATSGVLMWVPGSLAFLLPLFAIGVQLMTSGKSIRAAHAAQRSKRLAIRPLTPLRCVRGSENAGMYRISLPVVGQTASTPLDVTRWPVLGRFLRWRYARLVLQMPLLVLAGALIWDGLHGPQVGSMNLAGVLPWIHWRGLLIVALLAVGNVFCMACPFTLPRTLARRWLPARRDWPRRLRNKWPAVLLLVLFLWAYEAFALWDSPWWTAWIALGYFAGAFLIDGLFRGAAFCKYLCPIGQFNFLQSTISPLEVKVRDPQVCASCRSKDCLHGRDGIPGCEMHLFLPRKVGNLDCTLCLDCIHACPHGNIGISARYPASELWRDVFRSGIGRISRRPDLAALVLVLVFGAFANAAAMVGPFVQWREDHSPFLANLIFFLLLLFVLPLLTVGAATVVGRHRGASWQETACCYSFALVPLGFAMWLSHYSFHFLTSYDTIIPVTQRFTADLGWKVLGEPSFVAGCCRTVGGWMPRLEILFLDVGLLLSLYTGYRIASMGTSRFGEAIRVMLPWALLMVTLFAAGVWIVLQPMQMRGTP